jgi:hypothetical protein
MKTSIQIAFVFACVLVSAEENSPFFFEELRPKVDKTLHTLKNLSGCYFDSPKNFSEFQVYLPSREDVFGWCCTEFPFIVDGELYEKSTFALDHQTQEGYKIILELILDYETEAISKKKVYAAAITLEIDHSLYKFYLEDSLCFQELVAAENKRRLSNKTVE